MAEPAPAMGGGDMDMAVGQHVDEAGRMVLDRFVVFLNNFTSALEPAPGGEDEQPNDPQSQRQFATYVAQLSTMVSSDQSTIFVDFADVMQYDYELAEAIEIEYFRFDPFLRQALDAFVQDHHPAYVDDAGGGGMGGGDGAGEKRRQFFVSFYNLPSVEKVRMLKTGRIGRLVSVSGTVTRTSDVRPELLFGTFTCTACGLAAVDVEQQFQYTEPTICRNPACGNIRQWELDFERSRFVDWQRVKIQENADEIPPGSMPRTLDVILRHEVVEKAKAGDKMVFTGTLFVTPDASGMARAGESAVGTRGGGGRREGHDGGVHGLHKMGVRELTYRMAFLACSVLPAEHVSGGHNIRDDAESMVVQQRDIAADFTEEERRDLMAMNDTPNLYEKMVRSIAPTVFGHHEVKRGVLLMLFGGVHKTTPEGMQLRGDINVCIVGDPSTAKSQFLKYVHGFLPRAVFASGKASSAAGLTASVVKDQETGEFCVEAGALMLADNGICCIDEFDKMDIGDQVAIHEAMEQQTISITKAGIQATLNARTSILAAANPLYGRYDRSKTLKANVQISAPIMSRFDLFFVVLDECEEAADYNIAQHIIRVHQNTATLAKPPFSTEQLQRYIRFARRLTPTITEAGMNSMVECYRLLRQNDSLGRNKAAYRITVRQLESMIRLGEALARLHLDDEVKPRYVKEAYRLLRKSIIHVDSEDVVIGEGEDDEDDDDDDDNDDDMLGGGGGGGGAGEDEEASDRAETLAAVRRVQAEGRGGDDNDPMGAEEGAKAGEGGESKSKRTAEDEGGDRRGADPVGKDRKGGGRKDKKEEEEWGEGEEKRGGEEEEEEEEKEERERLKKELNEVKDEKKKEKKSKKKKKRKKAQISFEQYQVMTNSIATYLRQAEDRDRDAKEDSGGGTGGAGETGVGGVRGVRWGDVVDWYCEQHEHELATEAELTTMQQTVGQVMHRLLTVDGVLISVGGTVEAGEEEEGEEGGGSSKKKGKVRQADKMVAVHPNYDV